MARRHLVGLQRVEISSNRVDREFTLTSQMDYCGFFCKDIGKKNNKIVNR